MNIKSAQKGASLIEFLIVITVLVPIILLIIQTGLIFTSYQVVQYAAFTAARTASVYPSDCDDEYEKGKDENCKKIERSAAIACIPASAGMSHVIKDFAAAVAQFLENRGVDINFYEDFKKDLEDSFEPWTNNQPARLIDKFIYSYLATSVSVKKEGDDTKVTVHHVYAMRVPVADKIIARIYYRIAIKDILQDEMKENDEVIWLLRLLVFLAQYMPKQGRVSTIEIWEIFEPSAGDGDSAPPQNLNEIWDLIEKLRDEEYVTDEAVELIVDWIIALCDSIDFYPIVLKADCTMQIEPKAEWPKAEEKAESKAMRL